MDKMASSITIGIRELFRIIVPGLLVLGYMKVEFPNQLSAWNGTASLAYILIISFFMGLVVYVSQIHKWCPPWRNVFNQEIKRLANEVKVALGGAPSLMGKDYEAEYKHFLETKADRSFTERVHYFTSFYYLLTEISQLFLLFAGVEFVLAIVRHTPLHLVGVLVFIVTTILFHKFAKVMLGKIINEQIMMVKSNRDKFESIQRRLKLDDVVEKLKDTCNNMLKEIVLDPDKRDYKTECTKLSTTDWGNGRDTEVYLMKIHTAYPLTISGEPGGYKGFYKERVEAVLNHIASLYQKGSQSAKVIVEIVPTNDRNDNLDSLIPIDKAHKEIIAKGSPLDKVVSEFNIPNVLVRGRHLVGPNPGLLRVVEKICREDTPKSALDLFAGTGIISIFLNRQGVKSVTCVDKGEHFGITKKLLEKLPGITCVQEDAFRFQISQAFDLIVADPYYEDAIEFLNAKAKEIFANTCIFVFVCGGIEHEYQRDQCKKLLRSYLEAEPDEYLEYGLSVLVCRKP
jgi:hypothetical protein